MSIGAEWSAILDDLERGFALLRELPAAVTFFGGARITPDDPFYEVSREIGRLFAEVGIPPRTGAGPGIMTSVPEGYRTGIAASGHHGAFAEGLCAAYASRARTQGIKIYLPFEPDVNPAIDDHVQMMTFPVRRLMLYENSLGLVCFPGGFGTLDELFEVWSRRAQQRHGDPIIFVGEAFWTPILAALRAMLVSGKRALVPGALLDDVLLTDDPARVVATITGAQGLVGFDEDPEVIARRLAREIPFVAGALSVTSNAVTVFGGSHLRNDDPSLDVAEVILGALARTDVPVRVGTGGALAECALEVFRNVGRADRLQGFFLTPGKAGATEALPSTWSDRPHHLVTDPIAHKLLLTRRTTAFLALPGDLRTLEAVFSVLCEVQVGKMERRPIVLLGSDYWAPIFDACREVMLTSERRTISQSDLDLVRIVDTPEDALAVLSGC